jgi:hypothetical protein
MGERISMPKEKFYPYTLIYHCWDLSGRKREPHEESAIRETELAGDYGGRTIAILKAAVPRHLEAYKMLDRFRDYVDELRLADIRGQWRSSDHLTDAENLAVFAIAHATAAEREKQERLDGIAGVAAAAAILLAPIEARQALKDIWIMGPSSATHALTLFAHSVARIRCGDTLGYFLCDKGPNVVDFQSPWAKRHLANAAAAARETGPRAA